MPYAVFLLIFLVVPILLLGWTMRRRLRIRHLLEIVVLMSVALVYTTPWDNYLVANRVWWYDPALVTGITIGWVPIEEYTFFLLQPAMAALWTMLMIRRIAPLRSEKYGSPIRVFVTAMLLVLWVGALVVLLRGWMPGNYMALILVWALLPIALQTAFGADILVRNWRQVLWGLLPMWMYLSLADAYAIRSGTWTINPDRSLALYLGGILPVEEFVFFLVTNVLIVFSIVLLHAPQSQARLLRMTGQRVKLVTYREQTSRVTP